MDDVRARPRHGRQNLLRAAIQQLQMSARRLRDWKQVLGILKLPRTVTGPSEGPSISSGQALQVPTQFAGSGGIEMAHLAEAIQYRHRRQT